MIRSIAIAWTVAGGASLASLRDEASMGDGHPRGSSAVAPTVVLAQSGQDPARLDDLLRQQPSTEIRQRTVAPAAPAGAGDTFTASVVPTVSAREIDKLNRVKRLIEDMERRRGAEPGTVTVRPAQGESVRLEFDVGKLSRTMSGGANTTFGGPIQLPADPGLAAVVTSADVEYRVNADHAGGEQVVAVKRSDDVLANAFRSGEEPVTLEVKIANLTARQVPGPVATPSVSVTVGGETRQLAQGDVSRFGKLEVLIQASSNNSAAKQSTEGPAYALRLQVRSIP